MNETITRSAGARHGQEMGPAALEALAHAIGRPARPRTTLYANAPAERIATARAAAPLAPIETTPAARRKRLAAYAEN